MALKILITPITQALESRAATISLAVVAGYVALCRGLRYYRRDQKHAHYPYKKREDFANMTTEDAFQIVKYIMSLEFPFMTEKALQFALFRTYGVPSISKLLCETRQLSDKRYASRRYADTTILIGEFLSQSPTSDRANAAIARMNFIHSRYKTKISNDDNIYTLSLFVLEIERWVATYEWRPLTPMELCAFGTFMKSLGDAMGISWADLAHGPSNFRDGLQFVEDVKAWVEPYEQRAMVPNAWNHQLAEETTSILLSGVPAFMQPTARQFVVAMMDERLRLAMIYEPPSSIYPALITLLTTTRNLFSRWLLPPRPSILRFNPISDHPDPKTGRYYQRIYQAEPWYVNATFLARNAPSSWLRWALSQPYPDGKNYKPEGYTMFEVGPENMEKLGREECEATFERLMEGNTRGRCPFAFAKT
ncbi:hypothetical protein BDV95DRAFT_598606 [Massariosphaeria phaeospora]|uniref:Uncharacterized protein n=1 Tax=Massariosphaeria phaeospora TaxID=100035 RepID=A0A7C8M8P9_9PLEO|nr:hypothetical protein BDV95DRAFT_598606 [Massariosphaeria phaeospora]